MDSCAICNRKNCTHFARAITLPIAHAIIPKSHSNPCDYINSNSGYVLVGACTVDYDDSYYTINLKHLSYCWMPDLENQEWWVKKLSDGMPTLPTQADRQTDRQTLRAACRSLG